MIVNGVTLPDIPAEVLEQYPYIFITHGESTLGTEAYTIIASATEFLHMSPDIFPDIEEGLYCLSDSKMIDYDSDEAAWNEDGSVLPAMTNLLFFQNAGIGTMTIVYSNYDIYTVASINADTEEFTKGEIYFPNSEASHPERVSIGRSLVDGYAREVQRLTGTTDQMNAVQIRDKLSTVKAGIKIGDVVLPAIPDGVLESYPYAVITSVESGGAYIGLYVLLVSTSDICIETNESEVNLTVNPSWQAYVWFPAEGVTEWTLDAEDTEVKNAAPADGSDENCVPIWSNHDIYTGTVDSSTGEYTKNEIYFSERQNFNGVWLPKIPEDVLAEYPYAAIYKELFPTGEFRLALCVSKTQMLFIPSDLAVELAGISGTEGLIYNKYAYRAFCENENTAWGNFEVFDNKYVQYQGQMGVAVGGISGYTYTWPYANHDIYKTTSIDSSTGEITTGGLYFPPLPAIDSDRLSIGYDLFDGIVEEVQRLSGETDKMNALRAYWKLTTVV